MMKTKAISRTTSAPQPRKPKVVCRNRSAPLFQSFTEPEVSFAAQILQGPAGAAARRRSSKSRNSLVLRELEEIIDTEMKVEGEETVFDDKVEQQLLFVKLKDEACVVFEKTMGMAPEDMEDMVHCVKSSSSDFLSLEEEKDTVSADSDEWYNSKFDSVFQPDEMRCLALVAHNHMKPAMKEFVLSHKEILRKFRLTGTNTTISMLKDTFGDDPTVQYGPSFSSGPLGGDAELCALMCLEDLGGCFFFMDPLAPHPHQADIDCLVRLANVHNILTCINPCSAHAMSFVLKCALQEGRKDKIPSFFCTLKSPGVAVYQAQQKKALEDAKKA